jgi:flagellar motor switch protein FliM
MDSILTQSEIEALLKSAEAPEPTRTVKPIDLVAREHRAFAVLPQLQDAADRLAGHAARICTQQLRAACKATAEPVEVVPGSRLGDIIGAPRFIYGIRLGATAGAGVVTIDAHLGGTYVDRLFGSELDSPPVVEGPPSSTERRAVSRLAAKLIEALQTVMERLNPVEASLELALPQLLKTAPKNLAVVLMALRVSIGDHRSTVTIAIDTAAAGFRLLPTEPEARPDMPLAAALLRVPIEISAILGTTPIPVQQFLALKAGDTLALDTPVDADIPLLVVGRPKFLGAPAIHRGNLSMQINQVMKE